MSITRRNLIAAAGTATAAAFARARAGGSPDARPNFLFFFADQHRWDWLGAYGRVPVRTPNIDRLARGGVRFDQCRVNSPLCAPSRACLATGRRYHCAGVPSNRADLDPALPTFMKALRAAGYRVTTVGKTDLHKKSHLFGVSGWSAHLGRLGFTDAMDQVGKRDTALYDGYPTPAEPYMAFLSRHDQAKAMCDWARDRWQMESNDKVIDTSPFPLPREFYPEDFVRRCALEMLHRLPVGQPWFLQVNLAGPHPPYDAPTEVLAGYDGVTFPPPVQPAEGPNDHQAIRRQYAAMIECLDDSIGRIVEYVRGRRELDRTVIVYSADHGEMLGDHGRWNKGSPLEPSAHVPLVITGPGFRSGLQTDALVELIDLAATFTELADAAPPEGGDARSLGALLRGERSSHREVTVSALGAWRMITDGRWKLIDTRGELSLYDLRSDPDELRDMAQERPEQVDRLRAALAEEVGG